MAEIMALSPSTADLPLLLPFCVHVPPGTPQKRSPHGVPPPNPPFEAADLAASAQNSGGEAALIAAIVIRQIEAGRTSPRAAART